MPDPPPTPPFRGGTCSSETGTVVAPPPLPRRTLAPGGELGEPGARPGGDALTHSASYRVEVAVHDFLEVLYVKLPVRMTQIFQYDDSLTATGTPRLGIRSPCLPRRSGAS